LNALPGILGKAVGIACDASKREELVKFMNKVKQHTDHVDILVANAGATWGGPFETTPDWSSAKVLDLNVRGIFNIVQVFQPMLEKAASEDNPARIIIVSSTAGRTVPHTGVNGNNFAEHDIYIILISSTGTIMYAASKAAATHLGKQFAIELGPKNITTNTVSPGFFPSKLANGLMENLGGVKLLESENPRKRLGIPDDIGGVMVYLASYAANYINGVEIVVDGGGHLKGERKVIEKNARTVKL
jgi:NAD(P)-dependent dehydrogenase (short-subunit alcohol dehydrogenase family)